MIKKINAWTAVLMTLLVCVVVAALGMTYLLGRYESKQIDLENQITELQKTSTSISASEAVDETADWKTYTNTTYGFSFKYPEDWIKTDSGEGLVQLYSPVNPSTEGRELNSTETKIVVYVKNVKDINNLENYVIQEGGEISSKKDIIIDNISSKQFITTPEIGTKVTLAFVPKDDRYFEILCAENSDRLDTILSTFQFTK